MIHVRRHKRVTASGRTVTVRAHEREGDDGAREVPQWSRPASAADFRPSASVADERGTSPEFRAMFLGEAPAGDWWDDGAEEPDERPFSHRLSNRYSIRSAEWASRLRNADRLEREGRGAEAEQERREADAAYARDAAEHDARWAARDELRAARAALECVGDQAPEEEFLAANARVIEAEKRVPWWRR